VQVRRGRERSAVALEGAGKEVRELWRALP
jgi:hypothetical protein